MTITESIKYLIVKSIFLSACLLFLFSCNSKDNFYFGVWKSNKQGDLIVEIKNDTTITWEIANTYFFEDNPFEIISKSSKKAKIKVTAGFPLEIDFESCSRKNDQCLITSYKSYINKNMIDEIVFAGKDGHFPIAVKRPKMQTIQLPDSFIGNFYIIYQGRKNQDSKIEISSNGIGYSHGKPDLLQLFNANRKFYFKNSADNILIANPYNYTFVSDSCKLNNEFVLIQHGFNQSGREIWNKENKMQIDDYFNIEYFELKRRNAR